MRLIKFLDALSLIILASIFLVLSFVVYTIEPPSVTEQNNELIFIYNEDLNE